jgi:hypothetical protein
VATVVVVGPDLRAQARYRDGRAKDIPPGAVAELVSEKGNPRNQRQLDRVLVTAPCSSLPSGTEVVDTPGSALIEQRATRRASLMI